MNTKSKLVLFPLILSMGASLALAQSPPAANLAPVINFLLGEGDRDKDKISDDKDNCPDTPNNDQADFNDDDEGDVCDDSDEDNVMDSIDNCRSIANSDQLNSDSAQEITAGREAMGNACDDDDDDDGINDDPDNCPLMANTVQTDLDGDGMGDACDSENKVSAAATGRINDTGILFAGTAATSNGDACNDGVDKFSEQDCDVGRDVTHNDDSDGHAGFSFIKVDAAGAGLPVATVYATTPWNCVKDNVTGLMWEVKTDKATADLQDKDVTYAWDKTASTTADCAGSGACNSADFVAAVNETELCGYSDWRMPAVDELFSLTNLNADTDTIAIDTTFFPNTVASNYWSAEKRRNASQAFSIAFANNNENPISNDPTATANLRVRLVRGAPATAPLCDEEEARFTDNTDGTVSDSRTRLMWAQCPSGLSGGGSCPTGTGTDVVWEDALDAAKNSTLAGHSNWRLPNTKEWLSISNRAACSNVFNQQYFPSNTVFDSFSWSASPDPSVPGDAFSFGVSNARIRTSTRTTMNGSFLVRDDE